MFQNISHKIIICSYLFFFGNIIRICYKEIEHVTQLENSLSISSVMILNIIQNCFQIFLVSLMIYGLVVLKKYTIMTIFQNMKNKNVDV